MLIVCQNCCVGYSDEWYRSGLRIQNLVWWKKHTVHLEMIVCVLNAMINNCRWLCAHICETCSGRGGSEGALQRKWCLRWHLKELANSGRAGAGWNQSVRSLKNSAPTGLEIRKNVASLRKGGEVLCKLGCKLLMRSEEMEGKNLLTKVKGRWRVWKVETA